jgi:hypothetical protein
MRCVDSRQSSLNVSRVVSLRRRWQGRPGAFVSRPGARPDSGSDGGRFRGLFGRVPGAVMAQRQIVVLEKLSRAQFRIGYCRGSVCCVNQVKWLRLIHSKPLRLNWVGESFAGRRRLRRSHMIEQYSTIDPV